VTGSEGKGASLEYIAEVKKNASKNPVLVGFGISTPEEVRRASIHADGVIIGSALIARLRCSEPIKDTLSWIGELRRTGVPAQVRNT
jgi:tryptophan synthase alpha chain